MTNTSKSLTALSLGALGVVFGDIGTSPLYALQTLFGGPGHRLAGSAHNVLGIISLVIWTLVLVVSVKFILFIMRADNEGEGGIMALVSLIRDSRITNRWRWVIITLGLFGVALFYGDSAITPAISVLSAVEGLKIVTPGFSNAVIPVTVIILSGLFWIQKYGTNLIGKFFGPVMLLWFVTIAAGGLGQIWQHPAVLQSLSPLTALSFIGQSPLLAFGALTAVVLAVTGAEALYADMGHFGRPPIARAWLFVVFPALALCYIGQGAAILNGSAGSANLFLSMFPSAVHLPVVLLATAATIIASQSVISGAFSLTRQAVQLDFLPKMLIRHTSDRETGQIYLPFINVVLFLLVISLVMFFGSSEKLANAYGIAVSGTLAADSILFLFIVSRMWHKSIVYLIGLAILFIPIDALFVVANSTKLLHGGLFPIGVAAILFIIITTWLRGDKIIDAERFALEGTLQDFVNHLHKATPAVKRIPGAAVYIGHHPSLAPLALHATVEEMHELPEKVVVVSVQTTSAAHVAEDKRVVLDNLGYQDGISHLTLYYGFHDSVNIPHLLKSLSSSSPELDFDTDTATYIISSSNVVRTKRKNLYGWQKTLYMAMFKNAVSASDYYKLPIDRTEELRTLIKL